MLVWFLAIGACGVSGIAEHPEILKALSPTYALDFFFGHFSTAFFALAAVVLAVTGAEALYADMGHFGRAPITRAWLLAGLPGVHPQLHGPGRADPRRPAPTSRSPFFLLVPDWGQWPLVFLATAATVIASQAVITGAFSVAHQAVQLGYLPRLRIAHTSEETVGQIYVPWINWLLMVSVLTLVFAFETSAALAFAFGMAVTGTITITTLLFFYIVRHQWGKPLWLVVIGAGALLTVDLLFLAANLTKLTHGAWLPLLIGVTAFTVLTTWQRGRELVTAAARARRGLAARRSSTSSTIASLRSQRVPGTAVFLNRTKVTAPLAMRATVEHLHALSEHVVILSIETLPVPHVPLADRLVDRRPRLHRRRDHPRRAPASATWTSPTSRACCARSSRRSSNAPLDVAEASYFLSTIDLRRGDAPGMSRWRKRLFLATSRITADAAEYFGLPRERTVIVGSRIEV